LYTGIERSVAILMNRVPCDAGRGQARIGRGLRRPSLIKKKQKKKTKKKKKNNKKTKNKNKHQPQKKINTKQQKQKHLHKRVEPTIRKAIKQKKTKKITS